MTVKEYKANYRKSVMWDGKSYTLIGYKHEYSPWLKHTLQSAILLDQNGNSTVTVPLSEVEVQQDEIHN